MLRLHRAFAQKVKGLQCVSTCTVVRLRSSLRIRAAAQEPPIRAPPTMALGETVAEPAPAAPAAAAARRRVPEAAEAGQWDYARLANTSFARISRRRRSGKFPKIGSSMAILLQLPRMPR